MPATPALRHQDRPGRPLGAGTPGSFTAADPRSDATISPLPALAGLTVPRDHDSDTRAGQTMNRVDAEITAAGLSDRDVQQELDTVQAAVDMAQIAVRVTVDTLTSILRERRFHTVHSTGTSGGAADAVERASVETQLFGQHREHPVYAYLSTDEERGGAGTAAMYGPIKIVLREGIRSRTTVSSEDSLNTGVLPSPATAVDRYSFRWRDPDVAGPATSLIRDTGTGNPYAYFEAQVHGGVTVDDIDSVWAPSGVDPKTVAGWAVAAPHISFHTGT